MAHLEAAIEKVSRVLFASPVVRCVDYWQSFESLWELINRDGSAAATADSNQATVPIMVLDSGGVQEEWRRWVSPIDWVFAHLMKNACTGGPPRCPKYVIWKTSSGSVDDSGSRLLAVLRGALPWISCVGGGVRLSELFRALQEPTPVPPQELLQAISRLRLAELLSPGDRHHFSNLLAPLLILEGLTRLTGQDKPNSMALDACRHQVLGGNRGRRLNAVTSQIDLYHHALGKEPVFSGMKWQTDRAIPPAGGGLPHNVWSPGPLRPQGELGILLLDDHPDLGFAEILQLVMLGSCTDVRGRHEHQASEAGLELRFNATANDEAVVQALAKQNGRSSPDDLHEPFTLDLDNAPYSMLYLDLRLRSSDQDRGAFNEITGVKIAQQIARLDPSFPVVVFSSSQQLGVYDYLATFPNVITEFRKPAFTGYTDTLDPRAAGQKLVRAACRAATLFKMRFLYQWMFELHRLRRGLQPTSHTWKDVDFDDISLSVAEWMVRDGVLPIFQEYLQRGRYAEVPLYCYQVIESQCEGDFSVQSFRKSLKAIASGERKQRFQLSACLLSYSSRCRNLSAHGAFQRGANELERQMEDEAIFAFAVCLAWCEQLMLGLAVVTPSAQASQKIAGATLSPQRTQPTSHPTGSLAIDILKQHFSDPNVIKAVPQVSQRNSLFDPGISARVIHCPQLPVRHRLAVSRAAAAIQIWDPNSPWEVHLRSGLMTRIGELWMRMLEADAVVLGVNPTRHRTKGNLGRRQPRRHPGRIR
jgi:hypothetical protein